MIPILDSVVQAYLIRHDPDMPPSGAFGERAITLVRSYKRDVDSKRAVLREIRRELARRSCPLTEARILDLLIWSVWTGTSGVSPPSGGDTPAVDVTR